MNIVEGIESANNKHNRFQISGDFHSGKNINGMQVEFDISVATQNKVESDAKGKFDILVVNAKVGGSGEVSHESTNRIKFKVFIAEK